MPWTGIAAGVASLLGAVIGGASSMYSANKARTTAQQVQAWDEASQQKQIDFAREDRDWEYGHNLNMQLQAQEFQANMSNTAHQREINDMKAAGINPILSVNGGTGATTTSGTGGSGGDSDIANAYANIQNAKSNRINAITAAKQQQVEARIGTANSIINAISQGAKALESTNNAKLLNSQNMLSEHQMNLMDSQVRMNQSITSLNDIQTALKNHTFNSEVRKALLEAEKLTADIAYTNASTANLNTIRDNIIAQTNLYEAQKGYYDRSPVVNNSFGLNLGRLGGINLSTGKLFKELEEKNYSKKPRAYIRPAS